MTERMSPEEVYLEPVSKFFKAHPEIKLEHRRSVKNNPYMEDQTPMNHYEIVISIKVPPRRKRRFKVIFSQGLGIKDYPKEPVDLRELAILSDVMSCLLMDAQGYDNAASFEDWATEYGWDPDSRKAERIYKAVEKQTQKLKLFLGDLWEEANNAMNAEEEAGEDEQANG